jgi:TPR repeat protein
MNLTESAKYFKLAADQDFPAAQFWLAQCFALGKGVQTDLVESAKHFKRAADQNEARAQFHYALCLGTGDGVRIDLSESGRYFRKAAGSTCYDGDCDGDAAGFSGKNRFGVLLTPRLAQRLYHLARTNGDAATLNHLGKCLEFGKHAAKDVGLAAACYRASSDRGNSEGEANIGFCFEHGLGVERDLRKSARFYERSMEHGNAFGTGQYALSAHYGISMEEDLDIAGDHYEVAARRNSTYLGQNASRCLRSQKKGRMFRSHFLSLGNERVHVYKPPNSMAVLDPSGSIEKCRVSRLNFVEAGVRGKGGHATVPLGKDPKTGENIAVKRLITFNEEEFRREVENLHRLSHPCVVRFLGWSRGIAWNQAEIYMEWNTERHS